MTSRASSSLLATSLRSPSKKWLTSHYTVLADIQQPLSDALPQEPPKSHEKYFIRTAVLLNRAPTLSRQPTPFEAAMYEYNSRIGRALFNPFPSHFYFKPGSLLKTQFNKEERQREREAFGWGKKTKAKTRRGPHNAAQRQAQNEPTEGAEAAEAGAAEEQKPVELKPTKLSVGAGDVNAAAAAKEEDEVMPRITEADRLGDTKSLNRKGERNLYLLIRRGKGLNQWTLPGARTGLQGDELLHEAALRELQAECGVNMDAWIVGRHPIHYLDDPLPEGLASASEYAGSKTFLFKAHILAGQVDPTVAHLADFAWLTKEEVKKAVRPDYWANIRDVMSDY